MQTLKAEADAGVGTPFRVMLVDDSAVIRGMMTRWMESEPQIKVVASVPTGLAALRQLQKADPEVVVLDIEMPEMDGMTALPRMLAASPDIKIIMASTLTLRNADITLKALTLGAADSIAKPTATRDTNSIGTYSRDLLERIKALGAASRARPRRPAGAPDLTPVDPVVTAAGAPAQAPAPAPAAAKPAPAARPIERSLYANATVNLRQPSVVTPQVLAIGSSTGGPQALFTVFGYLKNRVKLPIFITQHMPATFTTILGEHLSRLTGAVAAEGKDGEAVVGGRIYIAPGDWHMTIQSDGTRKIIKLNQDAPENFCRPAVDPMFRSLAAAYGPAVLACILTGMGQDGMRGGQELVKAGGSVVAQDEATSVVWGMPGAAATNGICSSVLALDKIGPQLERMIGKAGIA